MWTLTRKITCTMHLGMVYKRDQGVLFLISTQTPKEQDFKLLTQNLDTSQKLCKKCSLVQPVTHFSKDSSKKDGYRTTCKSCKSATDKAYVKANAEAVAQKRSARYRKRYSTEREQQADYYKLNTQKFRESNKRYKQNNKGKVNAQTRKRQMQKLQATPSWANLDQIERIYVLCAKVSERTGVVHHVDHAVPLKGKSVCGLHVENNLQIVPAKMNLEKGNKFSSWEDFGY